MTIRTKELSPDDGGIYIQDSNTDIWISIIRSSDDLGYIIDVSPGETKEPTHSYQVWDEDVKDEGYQTTDKSEGGVN